MRTYKTPISGSREPISNQVRDSVSDPAFNILSFEGVFLLFPPRISSWTAEEGDNCCEEKSSENGAE